MTDIVEQARYWAGRMRPSGLGGPGKALSPEKAQLLDALADEIERLRAELENRIWKAGDLITAKAEIERLRQLRK